MPLHVAVAAVAVAVAVPGTTVSVGFVHAADADVTLTVRTPGTAVAAGLLHVTVEAVVDTVTGDWTVGAGFDHVALADVELTVTGPLITVGAGLLHVAAAAVALTFCVPLDAATDIVGAAVIGLPPARAAPGTVAVIVSSAEMSYPAIAGSVIVTTVSLVRTTAETGMLDRFAFHPFVSLWAETRPFKMA